MHPASKEKDMYWATTKPEGMNGNSLWLAGRKLSDFARVFDEGSEVIVSKGKPEGKWMYPLYKVTEGKMKKQKDCSMVNMSLGKDS